ncbi:MAG TPA: ribosomal L7Ae/L30e/S12e/Gadd45 family protein [Candidatus Nanoarchaeia archaeon]|nr:ribosomal L7Ae/L30e/S12e/Gadd45 family protein [Candidatus Nanoarchaeia archaeon]
MAKKEFSDKLKELKIAVQENKAVFGAEKVLKDLKAKNISKLFLASNTPADLKGDLLHYAKLAGVSWDELELNNEELGIFCKKNFFVSVIGIK